MNTNYLYEYANLLERIFSYAYKYAFSLKMVEKNGEEPLLPFNLKIVKKDGGKWEYEVDYHGVDKSWEKKVKGKTYGDLDDKEAPLLQGDISFFINLMRGYLYS